MAADDPRIIADQHLDPSAPPVELVGPDGAIVRVLCAKCEGLRRTIAALRDERGELRRQLARALLGLRGVRDERDALARESQLLLRAMNGYLDPPDAIVPTAVLLSQIRQHAQVWSDGHRTTRAADPRVAPPAAVLLRRRLSRGDGRAWVHDPSTGAWNPEPTPGTGIGPVAMDIPAGHAFIAPAGTASPGSGAPDPADGWVYMGTPELGVTFITSKTGSTGERGADDGAGGYGGDGAPLAALPAAAHGPGRVAAGPDGDAGVRLERGGPAAGAVGAGSFGRVRAFLARQLRRERRDAR